MGPLSLISRCRALTVALLLIAGLLTSCASWGWWVGGGAALLLLPASRVNHLYNTTYRPPEPVELATAPADARIAFVEVDDHGWLRDRGQAVAVLDTLQAMSQRGNVAVIVYVHGWRHNASESDQDVKAFTRTLEFLATRLRQSDFQDLRREATGNPNSSILGIYLGWRGKVAPELPGFINVINVPVYMTFWSRMKAGQAVGQDGVREFLLHLDDQFQRVNRRQDRRMSLVIVGHSFGGEVVFDAVRDRIEGHMFSALAGEGPDSMGLGERLYPPEDASEVLSCRQLIRGFGDLVVLVNPAIEAASYRRIDDVVHSASFPPRQVPVLLVVSARNDWARNSFFATARGISLFGVAKTKRQASQLGLALGSYKPQVTHTLVLADNRPETKRRARQNIAAVQSPAAFVGAGAAMPPASAPINMEADTGLVRLLPIDPRFDVKPALVVLASPDVINSHSDFFRVGFVSWLSSYVLSIQRRNLIVMADTLRGRRR